MRVPDRSIANRGGAGFGRHRQLTETASNSKLLPATSRRRSSAFTSGISDAAPSTFALMCSATRPRADEAAPMPRRTDARLPGQADLVAQIRRPSTRPARRLCQRDRAALGRRVVGFMSDSQADADLECQVYALEAEVSPATAYRSNGSERVGARGLSRSLGTASTMPAVPEARPTMAARPRPRLIAAPSASPPIRR